MTPAIRWLLMLLPFALWGTAMAAMTPLLAGAQPLMVAALRLLPAGVVLLAVAVALGRPLAVDAQDWPWLLLFAAVDGALFQGLLAMGLGEAPLLRQCTFSVWLDTASMLGYSMNGAHRKAAELAYSKGYFSESMFVRMRVLQHQGQWPKPEATELAPAHG